MYKKLYEIPGNMGFRPPGARSELLFDLQRHIMNQIIESKMTGSRLLIFMPRKMGMRTLREEIDSMIPNN